MLNWIDATTSLTATAHGNLYTLRYDKREWTGTVVPVGQTCVLRSFGPSKDIEALKAEMSAHSTLAIPSPKGDVLDDTGAS